MKRLFLGVVAVALAAFVLSIPAPMISSKAYANRMKGTPDCSDRNCKGINSNGKKNAPTSTPAH
jgi:hypothetical protein